MSIERSASRRQRLSVTRRTVTSTRVESIRSDKPDVSTVLEFADNLRRAVEAGYLDPRTKISGDLAYMYVATSTSEDEEDVLEADAAAIAVGVSPLRGRVKSPATRVFHDKEVDVESRKSDQGDQEG